MTDPRNLDFSANIVHCLFVTVNPTFPASPAPDPVPDPQAERTQAQVLMLRELGEMGMDLARALHGLGLEAAQDAASDPQGGAETGAAQRAGLAATGFARVARSVRQTVALENRLSREVQARAEAAAEPARAPELTAADWAAREVGVRRICRRAAVLETLAPAIRAETPESEHEQLLADLDERLETAVNEPHLVEQSLEALTARIRRELGLAEGWDQDVARIQSVRSAMRAELNARRTMGMEAGP